MFSSDTTTINLYLICDCHDLENITQLLSEAKKLVDAAVDVKIAFSVPIRRNCGPGHQRHLSTI